MPSYMVQVAYTSEAAAALVKRPQNRIEAVRKPVERLGGKIVGAWLTFGDHDTVVVIEMPDNISAAAFALALSAGGACKSVKTTALISAEEGVEAMKKAGTAGYKPATKK
jgi:uncharacterized protein with GYD domain